MPRLQMEKVLRRDRSFSTPTKRQIWIPFVRSLAVCATRDDRLEGWCFQAKNVTILGLSAGGFALHIVRPPDGSRYYLLFARIHRLLPGLFTSIDHSSQLQPSSHS